MLAYHLKGRRQSLTVSFTLDLMEKILKVIGTVDIAAFAVTMVWIEDLVLGHGIAAREVFEAALI